MFYQMGKVQFFKKKCIFNPKWSLCLFEIGPMNMIDV